ncbi:MAG: MFS transporter [Candidatus Promineifilaceae bacterium]|jgi:fucose permease
MKARNRLRAIDVATWASFTVAAASGVILAICLPEISATFSTDLAEGGGIETARSMVLFVVLLLAGVLAQRWGKRRFLVLGHYLISAGLLLASLAPSYAVLVLAMMIGGAGIGFLEALLNPLIVEIHPREPGKYLNFGHAFYPIGIMAGALLFGELLTIGTSWRLIFQLDAAFAFVVAVAYTVLRFPKHSREETAYGRLFSSILSLGGFWLFAAAIFLGASIESAFTFWSRSYVGIYLSDVPRAGALGVVVFAAAMAVGRFASAYMANKITLNSIMMMSAVLGIVVSAALPFAATLPTYYFLLAGAGVAVACFWPTIMAEAGERLAVNKTILFVLLSCVGIVGFGLTPLVMGVIGDASDLRAAFAIIPVLFVTLVGVLAVQRYLLAKGVVAQSEPG